MSDEILGDRRKALEESFFAKESEKLRKALQEQEAAKDKKDALSEASGITDDAVLEQLAALNIHSDTLAALSLVPLVEVAWADGSVDDKERSAILSAAKEAGLSSESTELLDGWLVKRPDGKMLAAWKDYIGALASAMDAQAKDALKQDLLGRARLVAEAAGGFLGLGSKVSSSEKAMLEELGRAFS